MSEDFKDDVLPKIQGHVFIRDPESGQVLLDKKNAVHYENTSLALATLSRVNWKVSSTPWILVMVEVR